MKPNRRVLDVTSTLEGQRVGMTIDPGALAHIMNVLTDLYEDPEEAIIREYSTNAWDSHIEAGREDVPIEVTTPTPLSPYLKIRDYGIGLDYEGIESIYSKYGASTKRESDDVVGMLGLGCKSALTYTDQFTLVGVKDGRMVQVSVSRSEDGTGHMTIVADEATDEQDGVEVIIPAKTGNVVEAKAERFFSFWKYGKVLLNGKTPKLIDGLWLTDKLLMTDEVAQDTIVMGNVPYPWGDQQPRYGYRTNTMRKVAFVEIGEVHFTPSREALQQTPTTLATQERLVREFEAEFARACQENVEAAPTAWEAVAEALKARRAGYNERARFHGSARVGVPAAQPLTWRGHEIPFMLKRAASTWLMCGGMKHLGRKDGDWYREVALGPTTIWFTGFDGATMSPTKRAKLEQWLTDNNIARPERFICVERLDANEKKWIDPSTIKRWADVDAIKLPKGNSVGRRVAGTYYVSVDGGYFQQVEAKDIDIQRPLFWIHANRYEAQYQMQNHRRTKLMPVEIHSVVALPANRIEKFKRDFPMAIEVKEWMRKKKEEFRSKLTKAQRVAWATQDAADEPWFTKIPAEKLDDPALRRYIDVLRTDVTHIVNTAHRLGISPDGSDALEDPTDKYLLLNSLYGQPSGKKLDHVIYYLNAAYAAERSAT